jgi:NTE family protein
MKPKLGIALGSGAARGWAHIGVLNALADLNIRPDIIAGCSIGALVGAAYACQQQAALESWVRSLTWKEIFSFLDLSVMSGGLIQGEKLIELGHVKLAGIDIESLPVSYGAVATALATGQEIWLHDGQLLDAVRASIALPGLFKPYKYQDQWLVDGGLVNPVPVSLCKALGADVVIAVNLNSDIVGKHLDSKESSQTEKGLGEGIWDRVSEGFKHRLNNGKQSLMLQLFGEGRDSPGTFKVLASSLNIMQDRITRSRLADEPPTVLLEPKLAHIGLLDFDQANEAIAEGRSCVENAVRQLGTILNS